MRIDPAGFPFSAAVAVPAALAAVTGRRRAAVGLGVAAVAVTAFFRDPDRTPDRGPEPDPDLVLAPADGVVHHAGAPEPGVAPEGEWLQVSTFLSLLDVHVNRSPYGGRVTGVTHRPGRFLMAFRPESARENERSELTVVREVDGRARTVVFRQVVGLLARRVVTRVAPGDVVRTGQRIGVMKFGSRMDVFVPPEAELLVAVGDRVRGGETPLARWPQLVPAVSAVSAPGA